MTGVAALLGSQGETQVSPLGECFAEKQSRRPSVRGGVEAPRRENCQGRISVGFTRIMDLGFVYESPR